MKNMKNRLWTKRFITVCLASIITIGGAGTAIAANLGGVAEKAQAIFSFLSPDKAEKGPSVNNLQAADETKIKSEKEEKLEEDIASIVLPEEFEANIKQRKDSEKILRNMKIIMAEKKLDNKQREKLETYIVSNTDTAAVYSLYDYFYENFFTESDMDAALLRYTGGESLQSILETYIHADDGYVPHDYPDGMLEYLLDEKGADINELAVLEILSHRGLVELDAAIDRLSNGDKMANICNELKVFNVKCKMQSFNLSSEDIKKTAEELGVSENEASKKIMAAKKAKVADKDITKHLKSGGSDEEALLEYYAEKYDGGADK